MDVFRIANNANGIHFSIMRVRPADLVIYLVAIQLNRKSRSPPFMWNTRSLCQTLWTYAGPAVFLSPSYLIYRLSHLHLRCLSFSSLMQWHRQLWGLREACPDPAGVISHPSFMPPCLLPHLICSFSSQYETVGISAGWTISDLAIKLPVYVERVWKGGEQTHELFSWCEEESVFAVLSHSPYVMSSSSLSEFVFSLQLDIHWNLKWKEVLFTTTFTVSAHWCKESNSRRSPV